MKHESESLYKLSVLLKEKVWGMIYSSHKMVPLHYYEIVRIQNELTFGLSIGAPDHIEMYWNHPGYKDKKSKSYRFNEFPGDLPQECFPNGRTITNDKIVAKTKKQLKKVLEEIRGENIEEFIIQISDDETESECDDESDDEEDAEVSECDSESEYECDTESECESNKKKA